MFPVMPSTARSIALTPAVPKLPVYRFTVDQYEKLIEIGMLTEDDDVELIEGWIVPKMARTPAHDSAILRTSETIRPVLPTGWLPRGQSAVKTTDSVPEPDVAIVRGPVSRYDEQHPTPADTAKAIEVADSSLKRDRTWKARLYARARIPVYWIINLKDRQLEVYTDPSGPTKKPSYASRQIFHLGDEVPVVINGREVGRISVAELFPVKKSGKAR